MRGRPFGLQLPSVATNDRGLGALRYNQPSMARLTRNTASATMRNSLVKGDEAVASGRWSGRALTATVLPDLALTDIRRPLAWGGTRQVGYAKACQYGVKRLLDVAGSVVLLALMLPLMFLIAMVVKLTSRGPALYRSERLGLGGRRFECLKFRTMHVGADRIQGDLETRNEATGPIFKIAHDPRVTTVGRFLRATALDELPQFFNILRGEMSLVGPRPLPLRDCERLEPHAHFRHSVLPGITGLWQVSPERHGVDGTPIVQQDLEYVERWSLWLDIAITFKTALVVLRGGADASRPPATAATKHRAR